MIQLGSLPSELLLHLQLASPSEPAAQPATPQLHSLFIHGNVMYSRRCSSAGLLEEGCGSCSMFATEAAEHRLKAVAALHGCDCHWHSTMAKNLCKSGIAQGIVQASGQCVYTIFRQRMRNMVAVCLCI